MDQVLPSLFELHQYVSCPCQVWVDVGTEILEGQHHPHWISVDDEELVVSF